MINGKCSFLVLTTAMYVFSIYLYQFTVKFELLLYYSFGLQPFQPNFVSYAQCIS